MRGAGHLRSGLLCAAGGVVGEGVGELVSAASTMGRLSECVPGTDWHPADGAATLTALRGKAAAEVLKTPFNPHAIIDGYVLKESPYDAYRQHQQNRVDPAVRSQ